VVDVAQTPDGGGYLDARFAGGFAAVVLWLVHSFFGARFLSLRESRLPTYWGTVQNLHAPLRCFDENSTKKL
jgi:hypothetical protein